MGKYMARKLSNVYPNWSPTNGSNVRRSRDLTRAQADGLTAIQGAQGDLLYAKLVIGNAEGPHMYGRILLKWRRGVD